VHFDKRGRVVGYWLLPNVTGQQLQGAAPVFVAASTPWGRPKVLHAFQAIDAKQCRGRSPLASVLTPSMEKATLSEFTLAQALVQTMFATTVESDLPSGPALRGVMPAEDIPFGNEGGGGPSLPDMIANRQQWYEGAPIQATPGTINHLYIGEKLKMHRAESPNSTFESYDRTLARTAAKAGGSTYSDLTGDYSKESFSSSRMGAELPHRINLRRRNDVVVPFYKAAFRCALEEAIAIGDVTLPKNAPAFWDGPDLYCKANWLGQGRVQPDEKKHIEALILAVQNNLMTLEEALAERGLDFESVVEQRKVEHEALAAAGLSMPGVVNTQRRINEEEEEGEE